MKHYLKVFGVFLLLSPLFISCDDDNSMDNPYAGIWYQSVSDGSQEGTVKLVLYDEEYQYYYKDSSDSSYTLYMEDDLDYVPPNLLDFELFDEIVYYPCDDWYWFWYWDCGTYEEYDWIVKYTLSDSNNTLTLSKTGSGTYPESPLVFTKTEP